MKKVVDIDLENLPEGTKVKIVDRWRKPNGLQTSEGDMDEFLGKTLTINGVRAAWYDVVEAGGLWSWHLEMFQAIQLPDSDVWYKIEYDNISEKYVATLDEDIGVKPEETIPAKEPDPKYMVYVSGRASPKKVHNTYESACQEAQRLAENEVGYVVSVVRVEKQFIGKVIVEDVI